MGAPRAGCPGPVPPGLPPGTPLAAPQAADRAARAPEAGRPGGRASGRRTGPSSHTRPSDPPTLALPRRTPESTPVCPRAARGPRDRPVGPAGRRSARTRAHRATEASRLFRLPGEARRLCRRWSRGGCAAPAEPTGLIESSRRDVHNALTCAFSPTRPRRERPVTRMGDGARAPPSEWITEPRAPAQPVLIKARACRSRRNRRLRRGRIKIVWRRRGCGSTCTGRSTPLVGGVQGSVIRSDRGVRRTRAAGSAGGGVACRIA